MSAQEGKEDDWDELGWPTTPTPIRKELYSYLQPCLRMRYSIWNSFSLLHLCLPIGSENDYPFKNFTPNSDLLEEGLPAAVLAVFKGVFGWASRNEIDANGELHVKCRGPNVTTAADVLSLYLGHEDCSSNLGPISAWVEKLTKMSLKTYKIHGVSVSGRFPIYALY